MAVEIGARFSMITLISRCNYSVEYAMLFSILTVCACLLDPYFHPIVSSWISENTFDAKKRAITAATYNVIVQIGSLIGSQIYRSYDAPYYKQGNKVLISICALSLVTFLIQRIYLGILNKGKQNIWDAMTVEEKAAYQNDQEARGSDGTKRLDFRFKY
jgi:hypothetical protein